MSQHIGIIGGLSTAAAAKFYELLARECARRNQRLECSMVHADIKRVLSLVSLDDKAGLAKYLLSLITRLQQGGAEKVALPAVTPHYCIDLLEQISPLPILSILDVIKHEVLLSACHRTVIFGTRFVMETTLFHSLPDSIDAIKLGTGEGKTMHDLYVSLVNNGVGTSADTVKVREVAHGVISREEVDTVILAGTDFVLLPDRNLNFPHIDAFDAYLRAVAKEACGPKNMSGDPLT